MMNSSEYTLYWNESTGAFAPEAVLHLAQVPYQTVQIDHLKGENQTPTYLSLNPLGQIPTLQLADGSVLTESLAIILHLVDCHPDANLAPVPGSPERARFYRWLTFMAINIYSGALRQYYPARYTTDPTGADSVKAAADRDLEQYWEMIEAMLDPGPYVLGESFSAADIYLAMLAGWYDQLSTKPRVGKVFERVRSHPDIEALWSKYFPEN